MIFLEFYKLSYLSGPILSGAAEVYVIQMTVKKGTGSRLLGHPKRGQEQAKVGEVSERRDMSTRM